MHTRACDEILYFFDTCANFMLLLITFFLYFQAYENCEKLLYTRFYFCVK